MSTETFEFQVEARQLLQMVIHSIYSNKDVFLRELVSNASDALDKLRIEALRDDTLKVDTSDLHIGIEVDRDARTLTVRDNGIGMSHDDVVRVIGTIAKSGTAEFLEQLRTAREAGGEAVEGLIGQFGIGFYSSFMVADEVTLVTRRAGESTGTRWTSTGEGTYTIETLDEAPQGTAVTLRLKPEDTENKLFDYTASWKIREIIKRYSDFITWPIRMAPEAPEVPEAKKDADGKDREDAEAADDGESKSPEPEVLNSRKALWARSRDEVSEEEYHELYRHISHAWDKPLETIQLRAEGTFEYQALLFLPAHAPHDLFQQNFSRGLHLYVRRVLIMEDCEALLPAYLRFVKGVVDAADLPLNVSREILQQDRQISLIQRRLTKKVLATLKEMRSKQPETYAEFWKEFGRVVKEGLLSDHDNRDAILAASSFATTHDAEATTTLAEYVERMKDGQQHIFYMTGESRAAIESSPHMEAFRDKGIEVLLLTDPVDEVWVGVVPEHDGKQLHSIARGEADLVTEEKTEEEKERAEAERKERNEQYAALLEWMGKQLDGQVKEVRLSERLTTSPACLVSDAGEMTPALENLYRAMGQEVGQAKRILELNPGHALIEGLRAAHAERGALAPEVAATAELLHGMALLAEGSQLADPARFTKLLAERLEGTL